MSEGPLSHLRILDCSTGIAGPYCTRLFAGFGALTLKIEPPCSGDPQRQRGPFYHNQPGLERSLSFHWLNAGKRSITLDLEHPQAPELLHALVADVDILVESFLPGTLQRLGFDYKSLASINPRLILVSISDFGQSGPRRHWKATDIVHYAMSGAMSLTGDPDRPPLNSGPAIAAYTAGLHAYLAALLALQRRHEDGIGDWVDVSIQESSLENVEIKLAEALLAAHQAQRNADNHAMTPWQCYPTADGIAAIIGGPLRNWAGAAEAFDDQALVEPPFDTIVGRNTNREKVHDRVRAALKSRTKREIYHRGQAAGLAFGYLASLAEVLEWPQHIARRFLQPTDPHPVVGSLLSMTAPFHPSTTSWRTGRAPLLGEHNEAIYAELGYSREALVSLADSGII
ncbi:CaiB/BaiF CoA-transferase family protein [Synechococcus sp. CBW1004]|uniref:CaiB/BaiF CoA transferase family protein n=1 Tax=Synechococcus sp. CBW1004 TaxID=1353136 RepID=UPI0018CDAD3F|nr:CoA transferase [Synechococcus sp. CBW1004]QPN62161.1 CoA transferase [Synechococcus sp. CBW1004]